MTLALPEYDTLAPLQGFSARRNDPASDAGPSRSDRHRRRSRPSNEPPPFGTRDGQLVKYTVLFGAGLSERVAAHRAREPSASFGQLAFAAITEQLDEISARLRPEPKVPYASLRTHQPAPIPRGEKPVRQTIRLTFDQADAIATIRLSLGRIEIGQLHRYALDLHLRAHGD